MDMAVFHNQMSTLEIGSTPIMLVLRMRTLKTTRNSILQATVVTMMITRTTVGAVVIEEGEEEEEDAHD